MLVILVQTFVFAVLCFSSIHVCSLLFKERTKQNNTSSLMLLVSVYLICGFVTLSLGEYLSH